MTAHYLGEKVTGTVASVRNGPGVSRETTLTFDPPIRLALDSGWTPRTTLLIHDDFRGREAEGFWGTWIIDLK